MRFSKSRKFVYLANPKTGSTSVRKILDEFSDHQELIDIGQFHEHWTAREYKNVFESNGWDWDEYYSFLTIRDPWKKFVSNYLFSKPDEHFQPFYRPQYEPETSFKHDFRSWVIHYLGELERFPPGCPPLTNFAYLDGVCLVNDIFPIETFAETALPALKSKISLPEDIALGHLNRTRNSKDYLSYYDDETIELVGRHCQLDIEIGGYQPAVVPGE